MQSRTRPLMVILLWAIVAAWARMSSPGQAEPQPNEAPLNEARWTVLWDDLRHEDTGRAYLALATFVRHPAESVPFLRQKLQSVAIVPDTEVATLITNLDHDDFDKREATQKRLLALGNRVRPALEATLRARPTPEARRRLTELLAALPESVPSAEDLRLVRVIEALEQIGIPEAVDILQTLARGMPNALPTREAKASLERLDSRRRH